MGEKITSVEINGIAYVPAKPTIVDCDGVALTMGQAVKVRLSALDEYDFMDGCNRYGTLVGTEHGELQVHLETTFSFPVNEIRRN